MDTFSMLIQGFHVSLTLENLLAALMGGMLGTIAGMLPGLGSTGTIALLLPISYRMPPLTALIMFCGIFAGTAYGGSTTSILVNVPGEGCSVVTCLEGYKMARRGRAGAALALSAIGSFVGGSIGVIGVTFFSPFLANMALRFGPPEFFAIMFLGLLMMSNLTGKSPMRSVMMVLVGIMIGTVGMDLVTGRGRFTFGSANMLRGFDFVILIMGLFGIAEIIATICEQQPESNYNKLRMRDLYPTKNELKRSTAPILRGSVLGFVMGLLPGPALTISSFMSYAIEKKLGKHPDWQNENGAIEGVAGPESANNAAVTSGMIPLLSLGIPFTSATAILLCGFMVHGVRPGPMLVSTNPELFWGLIASLYIGNFMSFILNYPLIGLFTSLLRVPLSILMPIVAIITFTGGFSINNNIFDLAILVVFGVFGYFCQKGGFEVAPIAIGAFIGPQMEKGFIQSMVICDGSLIKLMQRPIAGTIMWMTLILTLYMFLHPLKNLLFRNKT